MNGFKGRIDTSLILCIFGLLEFWYSAKDKGKKKAGNLPALNNIQFQLFHYLNDSGRNVARCIYNR